MQVPLGVLKKNEMNYDDMIGIMEHLHKYVPTKMETVNIDLITDDHLEITKTSFHSLIWWRSVDCQAGKRESDMIELHHFK